MILKNDVFPIGQIVRPHGLNGEMSFNFKSDVFDTEDLDYLIFEIDGILVPFFIEEYRFKTDSTGLIRFDGINSEAEARTLSGHDIFVEKKYLDKIEETGIEPDYFVGFTIEDAEKGKLGCITEVDQSTENTLFVIGRGKNTLLIPVSEDFIEHIDHESKIITVQLPEGLLDL